MGSMSSHPSGGGFLLLFTFGMALSSFVRKNVNRDEQTDTEPIGSFLYFSSNVKKTLETSR